MIKGFRHKGLERFFTRNDRKGLDARQTDRIRRILDRLDAIAKPEDMNLPGYRFHGLKGNRKGTWALALSGNWRITFRMEADNVFDVDLEDYH